MGQSAPTAVLQGQQSTCNVQVLEADKGDREVVLAAVRKDGLSLRHAAVEFRADKEVVIAAVTNDAYALQFAAEALQSDREVVLAAVTRRGRTLKFAAGRLQAERDVVAAAVKQDGSAILFATEELRSDVDFLRELLKDCSRPAFPYIRCFHVTMLSGRSCCFLLPESSMCYRLRAEVLRKCANELGLCLPTLLKCGELLDSGSRLLDGDEDLTRLASWCMHELT
eukprot:CAMPEP_0178437670 /NCGR_PEP_ID=MMETSP0689_2-20121128/35137_1 /TAXON_ID=160604 /ORGANISM="Amphidinium massartii, Strain CS-259" /LENGTH=224 /DNA_ID=CAMNT_0020059929 /DNA_START=19 /DNA_END=690 /DNA_ORIENTATION=+